MRYDLIIVGGGLVGAGLAAALQQTNLRIALIDARVPSSNDPRLFALNHYSCQYLKNLHVWPQIAEYAASIDQVHVSRQGRFGVVRLNADDVRLDSLGHVIPAHHIEAAINAQLEKAAESETFDIYRPATLDTIVQHEGYAELQVTMADQGMTLEGAIVVAADGANSTVRQQLDITTETTNYAQSAIVTRTTLTRPHKQIAYERFNKQGAIAMLPLIGNECATIWTTETAHAASLLALDDASFMATLQEQFGYRLGRLHRMTQRFTFPLQLVRAKEMAKGSVLLMGNSAHAMHPIAAQGFNLALYEAAMLVEAIQTKLAKGERVDAQDLAQVNKQALKHQNTSVNMSHRLANIFSDNSIFQDHLLSLGMLSLNMVKPVKKKFIDIMMGRAGSMPRLLASGQDEQNFSRTN